MSISGAVDPRARFVVAVRPTSECPFAEPSITSPNVRQTAENPDGFNLDIHKDAALRMATVQDENISTYQALAANHVNPTTIQF
ncbi:uncharacterized protein N7479_003897 [Penicillium vulpinum]|uniref:uncharacterized protein n=1 Tax=Penicillium vulpinum TaxID=29845 RepID=UPI002547FBF0|nr:uncharacterized protein N7479_003897 [Penicillium vulpinum]KAJ5964021.1 hypothetical protein N7479_003897 [Penicillium vulpinum]